MKSDSILVNETNSCVTSKFN